MIVLNYVLYFVKGLQEIGLDIKVKNRSKICKVAVWPLLTNDDVEEKNESFKFPN